MPNYKLTLLILGVWASAIPTGAILTESPLNPHVNPTPLSPLTTSRVSVSLSADHEIAIFPPSSHQETKGTDELGSTRFKGETNRSNNADADYYKQQGTFLPSTSHPLATSSPEEPPESARKPYEALHSNGRFPPTNESIPGFAPVDSGRIFYMPTTASASAPGSSSFSPGGQPEFISSSLLQRSSSSSPPSPSYSLGSTLLPSTTSPRPPDKRSVEPLDEQQSESITTSPDKPPFSQYPSTPSPPITIDVAGPAEGKQSNINLLRKLWASTRSGKLNLTDEHRSLLRIESESATPSIPRIGSPSSLPGLLSPSENPVTSPSTSTTSRTTSVMEKGSSSQQGFYTSGGTLPSSFAVSNDSPVVDPVHLDDGVNGKLTGSWDDGADLPEKFTSFQSSLSSTIIKPTSAVLPSQFDMTSLPPSSSNPSSSPAQSGSSKFNSQASLSPLAIVTLSSPAPSTVNSDIRPDTQSSSEAGQMVAGKEDDGGEATVVATKLAFPVETLASRGEGGEKENLIKLKEPSSSSTQQQLESLLEAEKVGKIARHHLMLYPEWLSSGGVYPDDDTSAQASPVGGPASNLFPGNGSNNNGAEYYTEPEYEPLMSGDGSSVARISSHLYNFAVPNRNLPPPPPPPSLTEEEEIRDEEEFKRYARLREKLADELLQDVVAAAGARRNWQNGRSYSNRNQMIPQPGVNEGEEVEGMDRESRNIVGSSKLTSGYGVVSTESPQAIIAQQSGLADVISRGRIDSVMYVYFGDKLNDYHTEEIAGRVIQAIGGVIAAVAQVLTVLGAAKCVRRNAPTHTLPVHLHIGFALLISNLLLLLAVHATEPTDICATVAMILHYLHLVIGCWLFAHTVQTYRELRRHVEAPSLLDEDAEDHRFGEVPRRPTRPSILPYCFSAWSAPLPFILMSYVVNPDGYETRHYCWMSIEKGMVVSFIVPVFLLIGMNTFLVVLSLRHLLALRKLWHDSSGSSSDVMDEHSLDEKMIGSGIRASAMLLPLLAVMWFLEVVALENATSIFFQIAAAVANIALSWLVMYFLGNEIWPELWCQFSKVSRANSILSMDDPCGGSSVQPGAAHLSFDNEPLLGIAHSPSSTASTCTPSSSFSRASMIMPSTSKAAGTAATGSTTSSAAGPSAHYNGSTTRTSSFSSIVKNPPATYPNSKGKNSLPLSMLMPNGGSGVQQQQQSASSSPSSSAPLLTKKSTKGGSLMKSKPNWLQPGGNEIYELKLDSISTICK